MGKIKGKPIKLSREKFDGKSEEYREPKYAALGISGGADSTKNHHDAAIARKAKALVEGTQISGQGQPGKLVSDTTASPSSGKQLLDKMVPDNRVGSVGNYPAFKRYARKAVSGE